MEAIRVKLCEFPTIRVSLDNIIVSNSGVGASHTVLRDRDIADQHPISAITGLEDALKAIGEEKIAEAVESALASAKQSGDFDGKSVTVFNVTESSENGGMNVITFSDGKKVNIKNGVDGKKGDKGDPYTLTEADKVEIVGMVIESLGGNPVFGYIDADNNIIVKSNLVDGSYTIKYEMANGSVLDIGNMVLDSNVYYSVTSNLTNCSISNSTKTVAGGENFSAVIAANRGYELKSVSVTMGGSAVSVSGGVINIASVTGNIVITAVAEEATVEINNLAQPDATATGEAAWSSGGWCNNSYMAGSSYAYRSATDGRLTTNTIAVEHGDTIYVKGINYANATAPQIALFDSSGNKIWHGHVGNAATNSYINGLVSTVGEDYWSFKNHGNLESTDNGIRFVRFAGYPSGGISDIIITRNQPID